MYGRDGFRENRGGGGNRGGFNRGGGDSQRFAPVKVDDELDVKIEAVGEKGDGIAKKDGFVIFIPNVKAGDEVKIKVNKVLRKVGFAEVIGSATGEIKKSGSAPKAAPKKEEEKEISEDDMANDSEDFGEDKGEEEDFDDEDFDESENEEFEEDDSAKK